MADAQLEAAPEFESVDIRELSDEALEDILGGAQGFVPALKKE